MRRIHSISIIVALLALSLVGCDWFNKIGVKTDPPRLDKVLQAMPEAISEPSASRALEAGEYNGQYGLFAPAVAANQMAKSAMEFSKGILDSIYTNVLADENLWRLLTSVGEIEHSGVKDNKAFRAKITKDDLYYSVQWWDASVSPELKVLHLEFNQNESSLEGFLVGRFQGDAAEKTAFVRVDFLTASLNEPGECTVSISGLASFEAGDVNIPASAKIRLSKDADGFTTVSGNILFNGIFASTDELAPFYRWYLDSQFAAAEPANPMKGNYVYRAMAKDGYAALDLGLVKENSLADAATAFSDYSISSIVSASICEYLRDTNPGVFGGETDESILGMIAINAASYPELVFVLSLDNPAYFSDAEGFVGTAGNPSEVPPVVVSYGPLLGDLPMIPATEVNSEFEVSMPADL